LAWSNLSSYMAKCKTFLQGERLTRRNVAHGFIHKQRNVLNAVPRRMRHEVESELAGIWTQPTKEAAFKATYGKLYPEAVRSLSEEEDKTLTIYDFPQAMHRYIRTTNAIESLFSNVRQRTDQIDVFTTEMSCLTIVWATIEGNALHKIPV
jgi:putative transposase